MFIHQKDNSIGDALYNGYSYHNFSWPTQFHKAYELVLVLGGELFLTVSGREHRLTEGDAFLITPYQLHSYETRTASEIFIAVFSGSHVSDFAAATAGKAAQSQQFRPAPETLAYITRHLMCSPKHVQDDYTKYYAPPPYALKACLYAACADFAAGAVWQERAQDNELIFRILSYIEEHYTEEITLTGLADALSYEYHYLSRVFHESLHIRFRTLVNQYRCDRAKMLITSTDTTLSEIAMSCGFGSIRSFNRIFLEMTGVTPSELRKHG